MHLQDDCRLMSYYWCHQNLEEYISALKTDLQYLMVSENSLSYIQTRTAWWLQRREIRTQARTQPCRAHSRITEATFVKRAYQDTTSVLSLPKTDKSIRHSQEGNKKKLFMVRGKDKITWTEKNPPRGNLLNCVGSLTTKSKVWKLESWYDLRYQY